MTFFNHHTHGKILGGGGWWYDHEPRIMVAEIFFGNYTCKWSACDTHARMCGSWTEMVSHDQFGKTSTHITQRCHLHMCIQEIMRRCSECILFFESSLREQGSAFPCSILRHRPIMIAIAQRTPLTRNMISHAYGAEARRVMNAK